MLMRRISKSDVIVTIAIRILYSQFISQFYSIIPRLHIALNKKSLKELNLTKKQHQFVRQSLLSNKGKIINVLCAY